MNKSFFKEINSVDELNKLIKNVQVGNEKIKAKVDGQLLSDKEAEEQIKKSLQPVTDRLDNGFSGIKEEFGVLKEGLNDGITPLIKQLLERGTLDDESLQLMKNIQLRLSEANAISRATREAISNLGEDLDKSIRTTGAKTNVILERSFKETLGDIVKELKNKPVDDGGSGSGEGGEDESAYQSMPESSVAESSDKSPGSLKQFVTGLYNNSPGGNKTNRALFLSENKLEIKKNFPKVTNEQIIKIFDELKRQFVTSPGNVIGKGLNVQNRKENWGTIVDGKLGSLKFDMKKLGKLHLCCSKNNRRVFNEPIDIDVYDLLTKRHHKKRQYNPDSVNLYRKIIDASDIPIATNNQSSKKDVLAGQGLKEDMNAKMNRFSVLIGSKSAGNRNPAIINEASKLLDDLYKGKAIDKKTWRGMQTLLVT